MYDTKFFIDTYGLKREIVLGKRKLPDSVYISKEFLSKLRPEPYVFNIETTSFCNMKCVFCQRTTDMQRPIEHMSMETFKKLIAQMSARSENDYKEWQKFVDNNLRNEKNPSENNLYYDVLSKSVTLHGFGEPLLDPMLPERVSMLTNAGIESYFSANPCNIKLDFIEKLFDAGMGYIKFAIDALDDNRAKELRGRLADFTKSYDNICRVLELKKKMHAKTVIIMTMLDTSGNMGPDSEAQRFLDLWKGKDVYAYVKSLDNQWLLSQKNRDDIKSDNRSHYAKQYCEFPWLSVTILADGSVVPCTQDINATWTFGNVNKQSLKEIWGSEKYMKFREMHISGDYPEDFMCSAKCDLNIVSDYLKQ